MGIKKRTKGEEEVVLHSSAKLYHIGYWKRGMIIVVDVWKRMEGVVFINLKSMQRVDFGKLIKYFN